MYQRTVTSAAYVSVYVYNYIYIYCVYMYESFMYRHELLSESTFLTVSETTTSFIITSCVGYVTSLT